MHTPTVFLSYCAHRGQTKVALLAGHAKSGAESQDVGPRDPWHLVLVGGGPDPLHAIHAGNHDKKVCGVAGGHKAVGVEHEGLIRAHCVGLNAGRDAVELGVRVPGGVLHVGGAPPNVAGGQPQSVQLQTGGEECMGGREAGAAAFANAVFERVHSAS